VDWTLPFGMILHYSTDYKGYANSVHMFTSVGHFCIDHTSPVDPRDAGPTLAAFAYMAVVGVAAS
jgi:hypothetical protein